MSQKSDKKDVFTRAIEIYKSKYKMDVEHLVKFIKDKIDSPPESLALIEEQILLYQGRGEKITEEELRNYLHVAAAVQAKVEVRGKGLQELQGYNKIKFKSRKAKEVEHKKGQTIEPRTEKKDEQPLQLKPVGNELTPKKQKEAEPRQALKIQVPLPKIPPLSEKEIKPAQNSGHSPTRQKQEDLGVIEENTMEEDKTSTFRTSNSQQFFAKFPQAQLMKMRTSQKQVQIRGFDKFGQNYFNPIIKYRVIFKEKSLYRRYTEFQNLMSYLNKRYEGFILPELPPKEGIKSNLSYFRGVDQAFLNERQVKLEEMLNMLMNSRFISQDEVLLTFLTDQDYEVESAETDGTLNYIRSLGEIAFNAKELKTYGMAYYNYFKSFKKTDISTKVTECYKTAEPVFSYCLDLENYRTAIINNFDKRREIFRELEVDESDRTLTITEFDKLSFASAAEVRNLEKQMNKYYELKSKASWLGYLISQKELEFDAGVEDIKKQHKDIEGRISNMQTNLIDSIDSLVRSKTMFLQQIGALMVEWRRCIHS